MSIRGAIFENQHPFASDHALAWQACMPDGLLYGCAMSFTDSLFSIGKGFMIVGGRVFELTANENISVSPGTGFARIIVTIDTSATSTETEFEQVAFSVDYAANADSFAELTQGPINTNQGPAIYQAAVAVLNINSTGIAGIETQMEIVTPGGTSLNFSVVGGTTQPTNPKENTIWVNTDTDITEWVFSATEPTSPVVGMVWFKTSDNGALSLDALKRNSIVISLVSASQYVQGEWVNKNVSMYDGTEWRRLSRLPRAYQEVEYLQGTGTQYINTGIAGSTITATAKVEAKAQFTKLAGFLIGASDASDTNSALGIRTTTTGWTLFSEDKFVTGGESAVDTVYEIIADYVKSGTCTLMVNGQQMLTLAASGGFTSKNVYVMAKNNNGSLANYLEGMVYYLKITIDGVLVRDFVPCYYIGTGEAGMYDLVNDVFYTNAGSGEFAVGTDVGGSVWDGTLFDNNAYVKFEQNSALTLFDLANNGTVNIGKTLAVSCGNNSSAVATTKEPVDLTGFNTLSITLSAINDSSMLSVHTENSGNLSDKTGTNTAGVVAAVFPEIIGTTTLDVSAINGVHYISWGCNGGRSATSTKIWLE